MASRGKHQARTNRESDSMEAVKPLVVLVLFGTILYGGYCVVQKGPSTSVGDDAAESMAPAPAFVAPAMEVAAGVPAVAPAAVTPPPVTTGPVPLASTSAPVMPAPQLATQPLAAQPLAVPPTEPQPFTAPIPPAAVAGTPPAPPFVGFTEAATLPPTPPMPAEPAVPPAFQTAAVAAAAAGAGAAFGAAAATEPARMSPSAPTYLTAESAPPPVQSALGAGISAPTAGDGVDRPDRYATLSTSPPPAGMAATAVAPPASSAVTGSSAAFATAWADAHEKLAAGRYAEALAALSIWYDDPSLGLEESQRLEDLLGQLAGSVIYSQHDLLLPPHVVAAGETLPVIAASLGVSWQLLGKINGVDDPQRLMPGEHLKLIRGPFDAVVSVSRRRVSLQLTGNYAGSFPVVVGRQFLGRVGNAIPVVEVRRGAGRDAQAVGLAAADPAAKPAIVLADGLVIEAAEDPGVASESSPATSLVVSVRDLAELIDLLGPGSKVLVRQ
ncbi:MAG: LysM peptidoglycan-binding domain-containing protein [Planctomycetota bacterium]|nr:MAG: LysM peptidoglycan-binding domain-containing protein [Planctomycetota bacterium]